MDVTEYVLAARLDPLFYDAVQQQRMVATALLPNGYKNLQRLFGLSSYQAARLIHKCLDSRTTHNCEDILNLFRATLSNLHAPPMQPLPVCTQTLQLLFQRARVVGADVEASICTSIWHPRASQVVDAVCKHTGVGEPYPAVRRALEEEIQVVQRNAWLGKAPRDNGNI